jgi:hypothetical protein
MDYSIPSWPGAGGANAGASSRRFGRLPRHDADAAGAAAMVLAGEALGEPKSADGAAEMLRVLRVARTNAVRARGDRSSGTARTAGRPLQSPPLPCL